MRITGSLVGAYKKFRAVSPETKAHNSCFRKCNFGGDESFRATSLITEAHFGTAV